MQTTPAEDVRDAVTETVEKTTDFDFWAFVLGTPLRVAIIILIAVLVNFLIRKLIRRFSKSIADGSTAKPSRFKTDPADVGSDDAGASADADGLDPDAPDLDPAQAARIQKSGAHTADPAVKDALVKARRVQRSKTVGSMLSSIATILISVIAAMMVLTELGFNLAPVLASAGIAGVAIGFGAQTLVKDYLSGFFLVVEDQYGIGDTVDLGEAIGEVEEVGLRTTRVRGIDGTLWHVRNGEILRVGNMSQGWARAVMDIPVPYTADRDTIDEVIADSVKDIRRIPDVAKAILEEPEIWGVQDITGEAITIRAVIKTEPNEQWAVARAFRAALKRNLDRRGITMPLPQQAILRTLSDPAHAAKEKEPETTAEDASSDDASGESVSRSSR